MGIIASVTRTFGDACDRTRITAEGTVCSSLCSDDETGLRALLHGGAEDRDSADARRAAMWNTQAGRRSAARVRLVRPKHGGGRG